MAGIAGRLVIQILAADRYAGARPRCKLVGAQRAADGSCIRFSTADTGTGAGLGLILAGGVVVFHIVLEIVAERSCDVFFFGCMAHLALVKVVAPFRTGRLNRFLKLPVVLHIAMRNEAGLGAAFFCTMAANTVERLYAVLITGGRVCLDPVCRVTFVWEFMTQCIVSLYNDGVILVMLALQINCTRKRKLVFVQLIRYRAKSYCFQSPLYCKLYSPVKFFIFACDRVFHRCLYRIIFPYSGAFIYCIPIMPAGCSMGFEFLQNSRFFRIVIIFKILIIVNGILCILFCFRNSCIILFFQFIICFFELVYIILCAFSCCQRCNVTIRIEFCVTQVDGIPLIREVSRRIVVPLRVHQRAVFVRDIHIAQFIHAVFRIQRLCREYGREHRRRHHACRQHKGRCALCRRFETLHSPSSFFLAVSHLPASFGAGIIYHFISIIFRVKNQLFCTRKPHFPSFSDKRRSAVVHSLQQKRLPAGRRFPVFLFRFSGKGSPRCRPRRAKAFLLGLGQLFQGCFPAQGGGLVCAALHIGKGRRALCPGVAGAFAALVGPQAGGGVGGPAGVEGAVGAAHHIHEGRLRPCGIRCGHCSSAPDGRRQGPSPCPWP